MARQVAGQARQRPHIAEWFGHRIYPVVADSPTALADQNSERCPFLSATLETTTTCVKQENSRGVCTISADSNGTRQDWLVCPYRALDPLLLDRMVAQLYGAGVNDVTVVPAVSLADGVHRQHILNTLNERRLFVYFQDKLGGEIGLSKTLASPEVSFDITLVELLPGGTSDDGTVEDIELGKYGVIELQTTDTHGSYKHAVTALRGALDLHPDSFAQQLSENPEWAGRKIEGPNISNVFKRTFYQIAFKFQATKQPASVGCLLALPKPVWDSWQQFLGAPELHQVGDGTWRLLDDATLDPSDWIFVFDIDSGAGDRRPTPINLTYIIGTDARTLSRAALDVAPQRAVAIDGYDDAVMRVLLRRLRAYLPGVNQGDLQ